MMRELWQSSVVFENLEEHYIAYRQRELFKEKIKSLKMPSQQQTLTCSNRSYSFIATEIILHNWHYYFKTKFPDVPRHFLWNATHSPLIFLYILIISFNRCGVWESLDSIYCSSNCWLHKTALLYDCTGKNAINKGETWLLLHSAECIMEQKKFTTLKWNNSNSTTS